MRAQLSRERREIIEQTANHIISREATSEHSENLKAVAELALLALAGMNSEPVAYFYPGYETEWQGVALAEELDDEQKARCIPLYAAPPAPVAVPDEMYWQDAPVEGSTRAAAYATGWNACRAAMLKAGPVTAATVPDGLASSLKCWCRTCRPVDITDMRFVVCPNCGNKRCPRANDHLNACSGSNETGQVGSAYPESPEQEV